MQILCFFLFLFLFKGSSKCGFFHLAVLFRFYRVLFLHHVFLSEQIKMMMMMKSLREPTTQSGTRNIGHRESAFCFHRSRHQHDYCLGASLVKKRSGRNTLDQSRYLQECCRSFSNSFDLRALS